MSENIHDAKRLAELQALPLERKIQITQTRIIEWYEHYNGNVCVSFSGGKDSTVLLHIARRLYSDIPAVFSNTGLEYASIQRFVKTWNNIDIVTPAMRFDQVVSTYGYPLIGKEVAEAIYYARRINSQSVQVEREREREREPNRSLAKAQRTAWRKAQELMGNRPNGNDWKSGGAEPPYPDRNSGEPQNSLAGPMGRETAFKRNELGGAESESIQADLAGRVQQSRGKWENYHRRSLHPDESNPADKECFWNKRKQTDWSNWRRGCL